MYDFGSVIVSFLLLCIKTLSNYPAATECSVNVSLILCSGKTENFTKKNASRKGLSPTPLYEEVLPNCVRPKF